MGPFTGRIFLLAGAIALTGLVLSWAKPGMSRRLAHLALVVAALAVLVAISQQWDGIAGQVANPLTRSHALSQAMTQLKTLGAAAVLPVGLAIVTLKRAQIHRSRR